MTITKTKLPEVLILEPQVFGDERGWFMESFSQVKTPELPVFVQDNHSYTEKKGVLRGIHFQQNPHAQGKLVRCVRGAVLDVAVDLRKNAPTYKQWVAVELSADNKNQLFIPRGFGHGFLTLTDDVDFVYKADNFYHHPSDRSIRFDDPELAIDWGIDSPELSAKDEKAPYLKESDCNFNLEQEENP